jgi:hypothetical protein
MTQPSCAEPPLAQYALAGLEYLVPHHHQQVEVQVEILRLRTHKEMKAMSALSQSVSAKLPHPPPSPILKAATHAKAKYLKNNKRHCSH